MKILNEKTNAIKAISLEKETNDFNGYGDTDIEVAIKELQLVEGYDISKLLCHYLNGQRFDKSSVSQTELFITLNIVKGSDAEEIFNVWLSDSEWTTCDECLDICDSTTEVRYKEYDFTFVKDKENIDCLCDSCFASEGNNIIPIKEMEEA